MPHSQHRKYIDIQSQMEESNDFKCIHTETELPERDAKYSDPRVLGQGKGWHGSHLLSKFQIVAKDLGVDYIAKEDSVE